MYTCGEGGDGRKKRKIINERETERERDGERWRERQRETETDRETERQTDTDRQTDREREGLEHHQSTLSSSSSSLQQCGDLCDT